MNIMLVSTVVNRCNFSVLSETKNPDKRIWILMLVSESHSVIRYGGWHVSSRFGREGESNARTLNWRAATAKDLGGLQDSAQGELEVNTWVVWNADSKCELCNSQSFLDDSRWPYLELHHVKRLADGGSETIGNAVCLCPNCHRACHYAANRDELKDQLYKNISRLRKE